MSKLLVVPVLLAALLQNCVQLANDNLKSVVVLYRHGDRAPVRSYPNDPYDESYWPSGYGQLTNIGKSQQYALGQWLRNRYDGFLPIRYNVSDIKIYSSNVDRCLMSAAANLAGLYPPVGDESWNSKLLWQPLPIHTTPEVQDAVLAQMKPCAKYKNLLAELLKTDEFQGILYRHENLLDYLSKHSGRNVTTLLDVVVLYNILFIEDLYNLTLPTWARPVFNEDENFRNLYDFAFRTFTYTSEMARLVAGPLIDLVTGHFENVAHNIGNTPKFLMLSAHDTTIASLLNSLQIFDNRVPEYASTVIFELREDNKHGFVNIFYKKSTTILNLTLPDCDFNCRVNDFRKIVEPLRISVAEQEVECQA